MFSVVPLLLPGSRQSRSGCAASKIINSLIALLFSALLLLTCAAGAARAERPETVGGEYLLKFAKHASTSARRTMRATLGVALLKNNQLTGSQLVSTKNKAFNDKYAKDLLASGEVEYIEPNYVYHANRTPNDSRFSEMWALDNRGQTGGTEGVDIDTLEAWDLTQGDSNVVVGVVDTGVAYTHPDIAANIWRNPGEIAGNGLDDDGNGVADDIYGYNAITNSGSVMDDNGHGTHTAGTIGAAGGNGFGVTGINWNVKIMPLKFLDGSGSGTTQGAIAAIEYAVRMKQAGVNIRILSNSWGGGGYSAALEQAISLANANGILFVAAAGNESNDNDAVPTYPANYELANVISVAAVDHNGNLASFSNYGASTVDIAAPGVNILSTLNNGGYGQLSGTSMATPHVSGVAALVLSREPNLALSELRSRLLGTVKSLSSLTGMIASPGIVSAANALTDARTPLPPAQAVVRYAKKAASFSFDSSLGNRILLVDDGYAEVTLPFSFPYFKTSFTRLAVSANGRIVPITADGSVPTSSDYSNSLSTGICAYHDDLLPSPFSPETAGVWVKTTAAEAIITWVAVNYAHRSSSDSEKEIRVQARLSATGRIDVDYQDTFANDPAFDYGASATVGIAPVSGVSGEKLLVSHNSNNSSELGNRTALEFEVDGKKAHNDFDGDGLSDIAVWRPASGYWYILPSGTGFDYSGHWSYQLGLIGDVPLTGDFDGDSKSDLAVWRPANGTWYYRSSSSGYAQMLSVQWGLPGDTPLAGDFDGDGTSDFAVYRPQTGAFYALLSSSGFNRSSALSGNPQAVLSISLGGAGNDPLVGDFNGDGRDEFAAIWQLIRFWSVKSSDNTLLFSLPWGEPGDTPLACDLDGDGASDRVMVRVNDKNLLDWFTALAAGGAQSTTLASLGDLPRCAGDFDGDGKGDPAVFRPTSGDWFVRSSDSGGLLQFQFGLPGDIAL